MKNLTDTQAVESCNILSKKVEEIAEQYAKDGKCIKAISDFAGEVACRVLDDSGVKSCDGSIIQCTEDFVIFYTLFGPWGFGKGSGFMAEQMPKQDMLGFMWGMEHTDEQEEEEDEDKDKIDYIMFWNDIKKIICKHLFFAFATVKTLDFDSFYRNAYIHICSEYLEEWVRWNTKN